MLFPSSLETFKLSAKLEMGRETSISVLCDGKRSFVCVKNQDEKLLSSMGRAKWHRERRQSQICMQSTVWNRTGALFPICICQGQEAHDPESHNGCSQFVELYFMLVWKLEEYFQFFYLDFFFFIIFLQHDASQMLNGDYAPVPVRLMIQ